MGKPDEIPPLERFLVNARAIAVNRTQRADYRLYDRLKGDLWRDYPALTPAEYERAAIDLARMCGV